MEKAYLSISTLITAVMSQFTNIFSVFNCNTIFKLATIRPL